MKRSIQYRGGQFGRLRNKGGQRNNRYPKGRPHQQKESDLDISVEFFGKWSIDIQSYDAVDGLITLVFLILSDWVALQPTLVRTTRESDRAASPVKMKGQCAGLKANVQ